MNKLVSIILPNYNHAQFLEERLNSIVNQTYQDFELIILDDCSTDGSLNILEPYKTHPKVSYFIVNTENTGSPFKQWQKGLDKVRGEFVWIAESDDKVDLDFLENQVAMLNSQNCEVVVAETFKFNTQKGVFGTVEHPIFKTQAQQKLTLDDILFCPILNVNAAVFRSHLIPRAETFSSYNIIGDLVFYHEAFSDCTITKNKSTKAYFRKSDESVSALDNKHINYYKSYFYEHLRFVKSVYETGEMSNTVFNQYVKKFFNRVRYRMSRIEKLNFTYLNMYLKYRHHLKSD